MRKFLGIFENDGKMFEFSRNLPRMKWKMWFFQYFNRFLPNFEWFWRIFRNNLNVFSNNFLSFSMFLHQISFNDDENLSFFLLYCNIFSSVTIFLFIKIFQNWLPFSVLKKKNTKNDSKGRKSVVVRRRGGGGWYEI